VSYPIGEFVRLTRRYRTFDRDRHHSQQEPRPLWVSSTVLRRRGSRANRGFVCSPKKPRGGSRVRAALSAIGIPITSRGERMPITDRVVPLGSEILLD